MVLYIPFIHKIYKKEKEKLEQIPLYIENQFPTKKDENNKNNSIIIIELF